MNEFDYVIDAAEETNLTTLSDDPTGWEMVIFDLEEE